MKTLSILLSVLAISTAFSQVKVPTEKPWTEDPELVEAAQFAHTFLDAVHSKNFSGAERMMNPNSKTPNPEKRINFMKGSVKAHSKRGALVDRQLTTVRKTSLANRPDSEEFFWIDAAFTYSSSKTPFYDNIVVMKKNGQLYIESFGTLR